jgi:hypothetical protein
MSGDYIAITRTAGSNIPRAGKELERVMGIEPTLVAWEATVLPLNYTRARGGENSRIVSRPEPRAANLHVDGRLVGAEADIEAGMHAELARQLVAHTRGATPDVPGR